MKNVRTRGSIFWGIFFIIVGTACLIAGIVLTSSFGSDGLYTGMMPLVALIVLGLGIYLLYRDIMDRRVNSKGRSGICTIKEKYIYRAPRSFVDYHTIVVTFDSDSDHYCEEKFVVDEVDFHVLKEGMKLRCQIYGESCFVDRRHIVIVREPKEE